jgi:hypothetical protein
MVVPVATEPEVILNPPVFMVLPFTVVVAPPPTPLNVRVPDRFRFALSVMV